VRDAACPLSTRGGGGNLGGREDAAGREDRATHVREQRRPPERARGLRRGERAARATATAVRRVVDGSGVGQRGVWAERKLPQQELRDLRGPAVNFARK